MESGNILQVLASFNAERIRVPLRRAVSAAGIAEEVGFTPSARMSEYMLAPAAETEHVVGTVVILRVEDWLRDAGESGGTATEAWARQEVQRRLKEFVNELAVLSYRGSWVWFMACPSRGWFCEHAKLTALCRTFTNLLAARVRNISQVRSLNWPTSAWASEFDDCQKDEAVNIPFTQEGFDRLGDFIAGEVARTLAQNSGLLGSSSAGSPELAAYLAGLKVQIELAPADPEGRQHVDRILRSAASFSLTGEKPHITDAEVDALVESERCILVSVADRLADHGPSGVIVYEWNDNALIVHEWSLSCTVLGKQVEYAFLSALAQMASERRCSTLIFEYRPAPRNQPMLSFLQSVTNRESETRYVLPVEMAESRIKSTAINPGAWSVSTKGLEKTARSGG
jgi:hypothetical protein